MPSERPRRRQLRNLLYSNVVLLHPSLRPTLSLPVTPIRGLPAGTVDNYYGGYSTERASPESPTLYVRRNRLARPQPLRRTRSQALHEMVSEYDHRTISLRPWYW
jgi:hypothetical protein